MGNAAENEDEVIDDVSKEEVINPEDITEDNKSEDGEPAPEKQYSKAQVTDMINCQRQKLISKNKEENDVAAQTNTDLAIEKEKTKILQIALEQAKGNQNAPTVPNPNDFDDGSDDPEFIKKQATHNQSIMKDEVARLVTEKVAAVTSEAQETQRLNNNAQSLELKTNAHYERVKELDVDAYFKREDVALEIFGQENINHFINTFEDSQKLLWYLGTEANRGEAERIADLFKTNPILGIAEIGGIRVKQKLNPKSTLAPDPDKEIKGEKPNDDSRLSKKLDKLREAAAQGGDMTELMAFKRANPDIR